MTENGNQIYYGTLEFTTDNFLLRPADNGMFIDLSFPFTTGELDRQDVSILGHMGQRFITESFSTPSLIAEKIVTHEAIAERAEQIHESFQEVSAFDNWLQAERELLGL